MSSLITRLIDTAEAQNRGPGELFEEVVKLACQDLVSTGDKVIDIGAHNGFHLFPMATAVGRTGRVYAFEPLPYLVRYLKKLRLRRFKFQIRFYQLALGNSNQQSTFTYFREFPGFSGLQRRLTSFTDQEGGRVEIVVQQKKLDSVLPDVKGISLIKIDIEGGELHALMGGRDILANSRPVVIFECGFQSSADIYDYSMEDFFGFFERLDYSVFSLAGEPLSRDDWFIHPCWEVVALPREKSDLAKRFPAYCEQALQSAGGGLA